jgi:hypothetical protein
MFWLQSRGCAADRGFAPFLRPALRWRVVLQVIARRLMGQRSAQRTWPAKRGARSPSKNSSWWEEAESRRAADTATEASWRPHASGSGDGGGLGGDSSWGAGYGGDVGRVDRQ